MTDYKGEKKLCYEYSLRPIKNIYADVVKQGDTFKMNIVDTATTIISITISIPKNHFFITCPLAFFALIQ
jgi:hypothetical protein